jgi:hypothetical protein
MMPFRPAHYCTNFTGARTMSRTEELARLDLEAPVSSLHRPQGPRPVRTDDLGSRRGVYIHDTEGRRYLEGMAGLWCTALGYGEKELARVAAEQMEKFCYGPLFAGKSNEPSIRLAAKLAEWVPIEGARFLFGCTGSDANDTQVKLMRYYHNAIGKPRKEKDPFARQRLPRCHPGLGGTDRPAGLPQAFRSAWRRCHSPDRAALTIARLSRARARRRSRSAWPTSSSRSSSVKAVTPSPPSSPSR